MIGATELVAAVAAELVAAVAAELVAAVAAEGPAERGNCAGFFPALRWNGFNISAFTQTVLADGG